MANLGRWWSGLEWPDLGGREALFLLVALLGLYMLQLLWRVWRLSRQRKQALNPPLEPVVTPEPPPLAMEVPVWPDASARLAQEAFMRGVEAELEQLRDEMDALRSEVAAMREEMRKEVGQFRSTQYIAPMYGDAMQLAQAGLDAARIAERCGIARAEAELVVALVRNQQES